MRQLFIILLLLVGACSTDSEPEPDVKPPPKQLTTEISTPDSVLVDKEAQYSAQCSSEDGILRFELSYNGPNHSFEKQLTPHASSVRFDTTLAHIDPGSVSIDLLCEADYPHGTNPTRMSSANTQIIPPATVTYNQTNFSKDQYETLKINLLDVLSSDVAIDSTHAITSDNDLLIERVGDHTYEFTSATPGQKLFELYARNFHESVVREEAVLDVASVEPIRILVQSNDTNSHVQGLEAHLGVYGVDGVRIDTLSNSTGEFEIPRSDEIGFIRARYTKNGSAFSFVRTDRDISSVLSSNESQYITRVVDFYLRDIDGVVRDELRPGARKIASPEGFRKWVVEGALDGVGSFNGDRSVPGTLRGTFNCYTESKNQRGPDEVLLADVFHNLLNEQTSYLTTRVRDFIMDEYNNQIAPWMGDFALEITHIDSLAYNSSNNAYSNVAFFAPQSHPTFGELGRVYVFGQEPNTVLNTSAWIRSTGDGGAQDYQLRQATLQEGFAAIAFMSRTPADNWADRDQSIVHNSMNLLEPSLMDGKLTRANWEETYGCTDQQGNPRLLYLQDVFGDPE